MSNSSGSVVVRDVCLWDCDCVGLGFVPKHAVCNLECQATMCIWVSVGMRESGR